MALTIGPHSVIGIRKNPTLGRIFVFIVLSNVSTAKAEASDDALGESEVIRLLQSQAPEILAAEEQARVVGSENKQNSLYPNPSLHYGREAFTGTDEEYEESISLGVPIDLSSRRSIASKIAESNRLIAEGAALEIRSQTVLDGLELFYRHIALRQTLAVREERLHQLERAARIVAKRRDAGSASLYELTRIEVEVELARSEVQIARGEVMQSHAELCLRLATSPQQRFDGTLELDDSAMAAGAAPSSKAQERYNEAATIAQGASETTGRSWIPRVDLNAGPRFGESGKRGFVAGVAIDVPLFSRGQVLSERAEASAAFARAQDAASDFQRHRSIERFKIEMSQHVMESRRFALATTKRRAILLRAAESAFLEGESSLFELVDARRAVAEIDLRRLRLALSARIAQLRLRAAVGEFQ